MTMTMTMTMIMRMIMDNDNETITQTFYGQCPSLVFLIYASFICIYKTFVVPLENCNVVSFDSSRI